MTVFIGGACLNRKSLENQLRFLSFLDDIHRFEFKKLNNAYLHLFLFYTTLNSHQLANTSSETILMIDVPSCFPDVPKTLTSFN